jgi:hypothetical protein
MTLDLIFGAALVLIALALLWAAWASHCETRRTLDHIALTDYDFTPCTPPPPTGAHHAPRLP